jgi:hypothetical protein
MNDNSVSRRLFMSAAAAASAAPDNVRRYSSGLPLLNVVDKVRGY